MTQWLATISSTGYPHTRTWCQRVTVSGVLQRLFPTHTVLGGKNNSPLLNLRKLKFHISLAAGFASLMST